MQCPMRQPCSIGSKANAEANRTRIKSNVICHSSHSSDPLLLRAARGEDVERTPVWLMRQAGRYMKAFREFSDKYPFRVRSETPDIAIELSLQPWKAFRPDGVIFFSDILTPLPAMGIDFGMVKGKGPVISNPIKSTEDLKLLKPLSDPSTSLSFTGTTLSTLRKEIDGQATLLGFIGTPWTLAAYSVEGEAEKTCHKTKMMMYYNPQLLHGLLSFLTDNLITYACYQIESGAQIIQLFDSWAHHLFPSEFQEFSLQYAERVIAGIKARHPAVPVIYHANGGTGKLEYLTSTNADVVGLDYNTPMSTARTILGRNIKVQGNVPPKLLKCPEEAIRKAVNACLLEAGPRGHILNVGHGVEQETPEENVALFCELARQSGSLFKSNS